MGSLLRGCSMSEPPGDRVERTHLCSRAPDTAAFDAF